MKSTVTITLDTDVINAVRLEKINLSGVVNDFLKSYLKVKKAETSENPFKLIKDIEETRAKLVGLEREKLDFDKKQKKNKAVTIVGDKKFTA